MGEVSRDDAARILRVPAVMVNGSVVSVTNMGVRVSFVDAQPGETMEVRSVVYMSHVEFVSMAKMLSQVAAQVQDAVAKAEAKAEVPTMRVETASSPKEIN